MSVIASTRTMRLATPARMDAPPAPFAARSSHGAARRPAPLAAAPASTSQPPRRAPRLVARAADPSGAPAGQVSSELMASMEAKIADALEGCKSVKVQDMYGDGRHVSIDVVADAFEGKNSVARQRMVYKAIWFELQETVHAVDAMTTKTPAEAGN